MPTVKIENRSTIDPTIMAVSPRCIDNFTAAFESPIGSRFFMGYTDYFIKQACTTDTDKLKQLKKIYLHVSLLVLLHLKQA